MTQLMEPVVRPPDRGSPAIRTWSVALRYQHAAKGRLRVFATRVGEFAVMGPGWNPRNRA